MNHTITRRDFLKHTTAAMTACLLTDSAWSRPMGANDDIRLAIVGLNDHGTAAHLRRYLKIPGVRVVALCDPDESVLDRSLKLFGPSAGKVHTCTDIRQLLEMKDVDAISGATPNHWHALSTVWACQAGKHVCVEKPVSHSIWEGRKMVEAAAKYGRLVQADLDMRSSVSLQEARDYIQRQELGKVLQVHSWVYKRRESIGLAGGAGQVPASVDYDLWLGPAPRKPLPRKRLHYDWHWQWDYGCGEIGNNGPHHLDVCRWMLGKSDLPERVMTVGGRFGYVDDGETPNTSVTLYDYKPAPIVFEVRGLPRDLNSDVMDAYHAISVNGIKVANEHDSLRPHNGAIVVCEHGYVNLVTRTAHDNTGNRVKTFSGGSGDSKAHFVTALRSGKTGDLRTTILEGHLSTTLCHMGNISYRVGHETTLEEINDVIKKDEQVLDAFDRMREHLSANGVDLRKTRAVLGPMLHMDSEHERFVGPFADKANRLVKRSYREPFVIRDAV